MKKRTLAIFVIVALAFIYTGASWYTGNTIASHIDQKMSQLNQFVNDQQKLFKIETSYTDYQKGIFSTTFQLKITAIEFEQDKNESTQDTVRTLFNDKVTVYHGPFPWSELKSFNFIPQMASAVYAMSEQANPQLWQMTNNRPYLTAKMSVDYSQNTNLNVNTRPIDQVSITNSTVYNMSKGTLKMFVNQTFSEFKLDIDFDRFHIKDPQLNIDLSDLNVTVTPLSSDKDHVSYQLSSSLSQLLVARTVSARNKEYIKFDNIRFNTVLDNHFNAGFTNTNAMTIDHILLNDGFKDILITDINVTNQNRSTNNQTVFGTASYAIGNVSVGKQDFGFGEALLNYENLPVSSLNLLANYFVDTPIDQLNIDYIKLNIETLYWQNAQGVINLTLSTLLRDIDLKKTHSIADLNEDNVDTFDLSLKVPFSALTYFVAQTSNTHSNEVTEENIQDAYQSIMLLTILLQNSPSLQVIFMPEPPLYKEPGIYSKLHYDAKNREAAINDKQINTRDFFSKLKLF